MRTLIVATIQNPNEYSERGVIPFLKAGTSQNFFITVEAWLQFQSLLPGKGEFFRASLDDNNLNSVQSVAGITVQMNDPENLKERIVFFFAEESELQAFLAAYKSFEWNNYCNGQGDGSLNYLNIQVKYSNGKEEVIQ